MEYKNKIEANKIQQLIRTECGYKIHASRKESKYDYNSSKVAMHSS